MALPWTPPIADPDQQTSTGDKMNDTQKLTDLPIRSVIAGPEWHDEVFQKVDDNKWLSFGSDRPWSAKDLTPRGPFTVLRRGESRPTAEDRDGVMCDECLRRLTGRTP